jgi:prepilin-type processing-associated H-X9-DG protein
MPSRTTRRPAFALADLLAATALVVVATGLLLPAVQQARAAADRVKCADNLRLIGTGARGFADANDGGLPRDNVNTPHASWNAEILAHIGEEKLAGRYVAGRDWWEAGPNGNRDVAQARVAAFVCPATPSPDRWVLTQDPDDLTKSFRAAPTDYVGSAGAYYQNNDQDNLFPGAMHHRKITRRIRYSDIQDGTSYTLLVVEMADKPNHWAAGKLSEDRSNTPQMPALAGQWAAPNWNHLRSYSADGKSSFGPCAVNCSNGASIYSFHEGGANSLFVDGSVRFLKAGMSQEMLVALVSIDGGEVLSPNDF